MCAGITRIGIDTYAVLPFGSSGPSPSVTSTLIASGPKNAGSEVYASVFSSATREPPFAWLARTVSATATRGVWPGRTATWSASGSRSSLPATTSTGSPALRVGTIVSVPGTKTTAESDC